MNEEEDLNDAELRDRAVAAARGSEPFDRLIVGASVADPAVGDVRPADMGLVGPRIASVHPQGTRTDASDLFDATGIVLTPGLIGSHIHIESSMVVPATHAATVLPRG